MTGVFSKAELRELFRKVGECVEKPMAAYLLGGGAMCFRNQKAGTKDLDLVFGSNGDCAFFAATLEKLGFVQQRLLEWEYEEMKAAGIWRNKSDERLDLFVKSVCGAISLSEAMKKRAELLGNFGNLTVMMVSNEDVILFKGITARSRDADDIVGVVRSAKINWQVILRECIAQSRKTAWHGIFYNKLAEIKDKHGVDSPIARRLLQLDREVLLREKYQSLRKGGMSREEAFIHLRKEYGFTRKELERMKE